MSSSLRRGALAATVLALSIATLSACGAGNDAQTLEVKPDNAAAAVGDIKLQNVNLITQPELDATGPAVITGQLFNNGDKDQTLSAVKLPGKNVTVQLTSAKGSGPVVVPAGGSLTLGGKGNASAVLPSGRESIKDGEQQQLSFVFSKTGDVRIGAFVVPATHYFKEWGPSEAPSAPARSGQPGKPGSSASSTPSGKAEDKKGEKDAGANTGAKKNEKNRQATATPDAGH
ncbi:lipoprotein [Streptomyces thioluteus]|uniref:Lipoprotein n=1 Tax=Streptomyces thioluteus TaxID=66431 RepID=A0ABN3WJ62_STRTU